jgi:hypothetical protein
MNVSLGAVWANLGLLGVFLLVKVACKFIGVYPLARESSGALAPATVDRLGLDDEPARGTVRCRRGFPARAGDRGPRDDGRLSSVSMGRCRGRERQ